MKYVLLGFFSLITLSAFSNDEQSNSNKLILSVYSGVGKENLDDALGVGTELMYKNVSVNLGFGKRKGEVHYRDGKKMQSDASESIGIKIYNSGDNTKNKVFMGLNRTRIVYKDRKGFKYPYYDNTATLGYRRTISSGIYLSPYVGAELKNMSLNMESPIFGLNVGYQFHPISLK